MKNILVTGASDGIGKATATQLAKMGHRVWVHGRSAEKARQTAEEVGHSSQPVWGDFTSMDEVVGLAKQLQGATDSLDILLNNAGTVQEERRVTKDGFEYTMGVNHFAHMLLTLKLAPLLAKTSKARVVTVASMVHGWAQLDLDDLQLAKKWSSRDAYAASKLANVLFAAELPHQPDFSKILSVSLHPGIVDTKLLAKGFGGQGAPMEEGAHYPVYCALSPDVERHNGGYFVEGELAKPHPFVGDTAYRKDFWNRSLTLLKPWLKS